MKMITVLFSIVLACLVHDTGASFAISSSKTPSQKSGFSKGSSNNGFGAKTPPKVLHTPDTSTEIQTLSQFLVSQKSLGIGDGTEVGYNLANGMRGMFATRAFKKNEIICKIPSDCALALADPTAETTEELSIVQCAQNFLDFYVKNPTAAQTWAPYLDSLPTDRDSPHFSPTPDFYSSDEISALEYPRAVKAVQTRLDDISKIAEHSELSSEELQFASWIVSSRSFTIKISAPDEQMSDFVSKPAKKLPVLLPYLDMVNHDSENPNAELHLIDPEKDEAWFALRAKYPIKEGKEIIISYGTGVESSVELLVNHGFVPNENKADAYMLKRGGDDSIENLKDWKTTLEEDLEMFESTESENMKNVLRLRTKLKRSYGN